MKYEVCGFLPGGISDSFTVTVRSRAEVQLMAAFMFPTALAVTIVRL